jgi:hypothetical protein
MVARDRIRLTGPLTERPRSGGAFSISLVTVPSSSICFHSSSQNTTSTSLSPTPERACSRSPQSRQNDRPRIFSAGVPYDVDSCTSGSCSLSRTTSPNVGTPGSSHAGTRTKRQGVRHGANRSARGGAWRHEYHRRRKHARRQHDVHVPGRQLGSERAADARREPARERRALRRRRRPGRARAWSAPDRRRARRSGRSRCPRADRARRAAGRRRRHLGPGVLRVGRDAARASAPFS